MEFLNHEPFEFLNRGLPCSVNRSTAKGGF
jgi:hypothetical protein